MGKDVATDPSGQVNVLLVGGGGREHALGRAIARSKRLGTLWTTHPENPGLGAIARGVDVPVSVREFYRVEQFCARHGIGLVVVGPEEPLAEGFADRLRSAGVPVFGPNADGARLEADKAWAKQLLRSASVPTAEGRSFSEPEGARQYLESRVAEDAALGALMARANQHRDPAERRRYIGQQIEQDRAVAAAYAMTRADLPVVKASGLAKGKGVVLPGSLAEGLGAIEDIMVRRVHGDAGKTVVMEERLGGAEASLLAIVDGRNILILPPCQDHKRLGDGDSGPNTGGMGAFCPTGLLDDALLERVEREILVPTVDALRREGIAYSGVLYAGLMLTHAGPKVLEFNCRFGDPECQPLMSRLRSDALELLLACARGRLDEVEVEWDPRSACCVVLASPGYPEKPRSGIAIQGVEQAEKLAGVDVYHAGTKRTPSGELVTAGGRVLGVTGLGDTLEAARARAYAACDAIRFEGKVFRTDIGSPRARVKRGG